MGNISSSASLKDAIYLLEKEQDIKGRQLKDQLLRTYESLKPVNLLAGSIKDVVTSPLVITNIAGAALGLATGYYSKKLIVGVSGSIVRKMIGLALQYGIGHLFASNADRIRSKGQAIIQHLFHKN